jgi:hypothetical protein
MTVKEYIIQELDIEDVNQEKQTEIVNNFFDMILQDTLFELAEQMDAVKLNNICKKVECSNDIDEYKKDSQLFFIIFNKNLNKYVTKFRKTTQN